jgi:hypothetical protein
VDLGHFQWVCVSNRKAILQQSVQQEIVSLTKEGIGVSMVAPLIGCCLQFDVEVKIETRTSPLAALTCVGVIE